MAAEMSGQQTLRRRMHFLERAQSELSAAASAKQPVENTPDSPTRPESSVLITDEEVESDSESPSEVSEKSPVRPVRSRPTPRHPSDVNVGERNRAWYDFDVAVIFALVSPIGKWLTGGDYLKNLLLIVLLIFYLHQIIEAPWSLYLSSRPRRRQPELTRSASSSKAEDAYRSELRLFELFFLSLAVISPFIGAYLLRYVSHAVTGEDIVSWFSTGLFVLATGIRPWSHLIERLSRRVSDLHDAIHYPRESDSDTALRDELASLQRRLDSFEKKLRSRTEDVYDYVDEAVDALEKAVMKQDKRREKQEGRIRDVEVKLESTKRWNNTSSILAPKPTRIMNFLPSWLPFASGPPSPPSPSSPRAKQQRLRNPLFRSFSPSSLETIPEEKTSRTPPPPLPPPRPSFLRRLFQRLMYIVTLPLRIFFKLS